MVSTHRIEVPLWPTCMNNLSWSSDSEIAIATGETIEILIPKLQLSPALKFDDDVEDNNWHRVRLTTNLFTLDEWPYTEPLPFRSFSIGEEQSTSLVAALAWSSPDLANHDRCALAVLTTNHVLSIWAPEENHQDADSWKRVLILNDALKVFAKVVNQAADKSFNMGINEIAAKRSRIRAFSWAGHMHDVSVSSPATDSNSMRARRPHILVLSNECDELIMLEVQSSFTDRFSSGSAWSATVVGSFSNRDGSEESPSLPLSIASILGSKTAITHLSLSPWATGDHGEALHSVLAYVSRSKLCLRRCTLSVSESGLSVTFADEELVWPGVHRNLTAWHLEPDTDRLLLACFTTTTVICLTVPAPRRDFLQKDVTVAIRQREERWDEIIGVSHAKTSELGLALEYATHLSSHRKGFARLQWPPTQASTETLTDWTRYVDELSTEFSEEHQLAGHVAIRSWGLTSSPMNDQVAFCFTLHPSDMIQYAMVSEQKSIVVIHSVDGPPLSFTPGSSAETYLFSILRRMRQNNSERPGHLNINMASLYSDREASALLNKIITARSAQEAAHFIRGALDSRGAFCRRVTYHIDQWINKSSYAMANGSPPAPEIEERLCLAALSVPTSLYKQTPLGRRLLSMYRQCLSKLGRQPQDALSGLLENSQSDQSEVCEMCDEVIEFENSQMACCSNGHQYVRCGLTFLAVQEPGVSKHCGLCRKRYLNEEYLRAVEDPQPTLAYDVDVDTVMGDHSQEAHAFGTNPLISLAKLLFVACNVCIYCGGKFIG